MSDSEAGKLPSSQWAVARLFQASERSGAISISLLKVSTEPFSWRCCISAMPRIISSRCRPSGTMVHCSQIAASRLWTATGSVAVCSLANKVSSMVLLPPFCASALIPSITPSSAAKQARKQVMAFLLQSRRPGSAGRPVEQLDGVCNRNASAAGNVADAAEVAGGDDVGPDALDIGDLAVAQAARQFGLQQLVGAGPTAADMALGHVLDDEARVAEQLLGLLDHLLAMLHRTGRMIGHGERPRGHVRETEVEHELAHILGEARHLRGLVLPHRVVG